MMMKRVLFILGVALLTCCSAEYVYPVRLSKAFHIEMQENGETTDIKAMMLGGNKGFRRDSVNGVVKRLVLYGDLYNSGKCLIFQYGQEGCTKEEKSKDESSSDCSPMFKFNVFNSALNDNVLFPWKFTFTEGQVEKTVCPSNPNGNADCTKYSSTSTGNYMTLDPEGRCVSVKMSEKVRTFFYKDDLPSVDDFIPSAECPGEYPAPKVFIPPDMDCAFSYKYTQGPYEEEYKVLFLNHASAMFRRKSLQGSTKEYIFFTNGDRITGGKLLNPATCENIVESDMYSTSTILFSASFNPMPPNGVPLCSEYSEGPSTIEYEGQPGCTQYVIDNSYSIILDNKNRVIVFKSYKYEYLDYIPTAKDFAFCENNAPTGAPDVSPCQGGGGGGGGGGGSTAPASAAMTKVSASILLLILAALLF